MKSELLEIFDENGKSLGTKERTLVHKDGDWHRSVHIYVLNSKGEFLVHLRAPFKDLHPNCWDSRFGGHVSTGDTVEQTVVRELEEEVGIKAKDGELIKGMTYKYDGKTNREFNPAFLYNLKEGDVIKFNDKEVVKVRWMSVEEILESIEKDPKKWTDGAGIVDEIYENWKKYEGHKAAIWNRRNGDNGEPYKNFVTDPLIIDLIQPIKGKLIIDQGCGNGYLSKKIARENPRKIILLDYFEGNLKYAKNNLKNIEGRFEYKQSDLNKPIKLESKIVDCILSCFVLNELEHIEITIQESFRILKHGGMYLIAVVHPCYDLKQYLIEKLTGTISKKLKPVGSYFDRRKGKFIFGVDTHEILEATHFHRTMEDYFSILRSFGFTIDKIIEPQINEELLKEAERFKFDQDCPIALIIKAIKP